MPNDVEARQGLMATTEDAFLSGKLTIEQSLHGSRAGLDAVFLAAACPARAGEQVLDAGAGSGIVALAIARRVEGVTVAGIEIDADLCELARRNAQRNNLTDRATFHCGDLSAPLSQLFALGLAPDSFGHAVANPPFLEAGEARLPPDPMLSRAHACAPGALESWIKRLASLVAPRGSVTLVHRADALPRLLAHLQGRFGGLTVYPLFPREKQPATRILIQGWKGSRAPMRLMRGMVLHGAGNGFTAEAEPILRNGAGLEVDPRD